MSLRDSQGVVKNGDRLAGNLKVGDEKHWPRNALVVTQFTGSKWGCYARHHSPDKSGHYQRARCRVYSGGSVQQWTANRRSNLSGRCFDRTRRLFTFSHIVRTLHVFPSLANCSYTACCSTSPAHSTTTIHNDRALAAPPGLLGPVAFAAHFRREDLQRRCKGFSQGCPSI